MNTLSPPIKEKKSLKNKSDLIIFAGETSGDLLGASLINALHRISDFKISAVAGPKMRQQKIDVLYPMEKFNIMGFSDILFALPRIIKNFYHLRRVFLHLNPKAIIFIDYPDFSLRMEKSLRKKGYRGKIIHYVSPTVWAWRKSRMHVLEKNVDLLLSILPFETKVYENSPLKVRYIGHPLVNQVPQKKNAIPQSLGVFPGSRKKEILRNLPLQLRVLRRLMCEDHNIQFSICVADRKFLPLIHKIIQEAELEKKCSLCFSETKNDMLLSIDGAIATSGTITLELALASVPTVVTYAISSIDLFLARKILHIDQLPFYCLTNIIAQKEIFCELYGPNLTETALYTQTKKILYNIRIRDKIHQECQNIRKILGSTDASDEGAKEILELLSPGI